MQKSKSEKTTTIDFNVQWKVQHDYILKLIVYLKAHKYEDYDTPQK